MSLRTVAFLPFQIPRTLLLAFTSLSVLTACSSDPASTSQSCSPSSFSLGGPSSRPAAWNQIHHIVVIVLENTESTSAEIQPYEASLISSGARLLQSYGVSRPSQPNYLALIGGSDFGVNHDSEVNLPDTHLGDLLESATKTWKVYAESLPGTCNLVMTSGSYARRHVPFYNFTSVTTNATRCARIVNATEFTSDVSSNTLPDVSFYIPNNQSNGHDTSPIFSDQWLQTTFSTHFSNPTLMANTLFILTYDEGAVSGPTQNKVFTLFLGAGVQPGSNTSSCINHYGILATIENIFELGSLHRNDENATQVTGIWNP
jgi:hypothetical protein